MMLVLGGTERAPGDAAQKAVPRMRKGTEYPAAIAAPLMSGLEAAAVPSLGRKGEAMAGREE